VVARAQAALPHVAAPTLVVCSALDHRVPPPTVEAAYARLRAARKELVRLERCGHVLTVDHERERVFTLVREWLARHAGRTAAAAAAPAER
jgi:esterase/lipase